MSNYSNAITRTPSEKHGERASMLDYGAKADGMILTDGAITSGLQIFTSATAAFTAADISKTIWIEGAGAAGADLLTTISNYTNATTVQVTAAASTTVTGALTRYGTECSAQIQLACNEALGYRGDLGFCVELTRGRYLTTASIVPTHNLVIKGMGWSYHVYGTKSPSLIMCCANVPVIDYTSTSGDGWQSGVIEKVAFNGTRRSGSKGIHTAKATGLLLRDCTFNWFGDQAVHCEGGVFDNHFYNLHVTGACLVRSRAAYVGCIDVAQSDLMIENCIASASCSHDGVNPIPVVSGNYGSGFIAAFAIRGGNCWMSDCMAHHSQIGMYVGSGVSDTGFVNVRADDNQGHGWVIDGNANNFVGCRAFADGQDTDATYSAFLVNGGDNDFVNTQINNFGYGGSPPSPLYNRYKYGFDLATPNTSAGNRLLNSKIQPYAVTLDDYKISGTQPTHAIVDLTVLDPTGTSTLRLLTDMSVREKSVYMVQTTGPTDEKVWRRRLNYGVGFSQLIDSVLKDDYTTEAIYQFTHRGTGATISYHQFSVLLKAVRGLQLTGDLEITSGKLIFQASTVSVSAGSGSPETVVTAVGAALYLDYTNAKVYYKASGSGNTGWALLSGASTLPVVDSTAVVKGSSDATKLVRVEADGLTTATTRVATMPDRDITLNQIPTQEANSSADDTMTTSSADLTNCALTLALVGRYKITGVFEINIDATNSVVGELDIFYSSTDHTQTKTAFFANGSASVMTVTCTQTWYWDNTVSVTAKLRGRKTGAGGTSKILQTNTNITAEFLG